MKVVGAQVTAAVLAGWTPSVEWAAADWLSCPPLGCGATFRGPQPGAGCVDVETVV